MPKLNTDKAAQAADAAEEGGEYEPLPEGSYLLKLREVTSREGTKAPYWSWEFEVAEGDHKGRRVWESTSLSESALWRVGLVFKAFGVPTGTDTDELVGKQVRAWLVQEVQSQGKGAGTIRNRVDSFQQLTVEDLASNDEVPF